MGLTRPPQVSARIAGLILEYADARGAHREQIACAAGFDPDVLSDPDARIPLSQENALWTLAADAACDDDFGLHAAEQLRPGTMGVIDYVVRTAPDVRTALHRLARYNRLMHDVATFTVAELTQGTQVLHRFDAVARMPCRHASEFTLASVIVVAAQATGLPVRAHSIAFAHAAPASTREHQRVFGVRPSFSAEASSLVLSRETVDLPILAADAALSHVVGAYAELLLKSRPPLTENVSLRVRRFVVDELGKGIPTLARVAEHLHMSERTLQRRIKDEGTCFADIVDSVRKDAALQYVAEPKLSLAEVAYLLGFSEPSTFHRAFKRWTGKGPNSLRRSRSGRSLTTSG